MPGINPYGTVEYNNEIKKLLAQIAAISVGQLVIKAITGTNKDVSILPFAAFDPKNPKQCRAVTSFEKGSDAAPKGVGGKDRTDTRDKLYLGRSDNPDTDDHDERYDTAGVKEIGTGAGSNAAVWFTPGEFSSTGCFKSSSGALPDEVFVHELVHAVRMTQGAYNPVPTTGRNASYHNDEEFLAIVVTNVYISAKNPSRKLVANHFDYSALWDPLDKSKGFVDDAENHELLSHYMNDSRWPFLKDLAKLKTIKFNPFYEFAKRPAKSAAKAKPAAKK